VRRLARALRLRCPNCGGAGLMQSWFVLRARCTACGMRLQRGEDQDYWLMADLLFRPPGPADFAPERDAG